MGVIKDLTGQRFGKLVVVSLEGRNKYGRAMWLCKCDCGNTTVASSNNLLRGCVKSCGCLSHSTVNIGDKFSRLTVIGDGEKDHRGRKTIRCQCDCGNIVDVLPNCLVSGNTKSCGCLKIDKLVERSTKHGHTGERLYNIHNAMCQRCYNENAYKYPNYGARGITVCDEWRYDFQAFYDWAMSNATGMI